MKANELRIGNYVNFGIVNEPIKLTGGIDSENSTIIMAQPIPLTEEWLLKFGFVKDTQIFDIQYYEKQFLKASTLSIQLCNGICEKRNASIGYDLEWIFIGDIKHVHQLQNLYHALTGKELTI